MQAPGLGASDGATNSLYLRGNHPSFHPTAIRPQGLTSLRWYPCVGETAPESILSPGSRAILCGVAMNLAATPAVASRQLKRWQISRLDADEIQ